jgi:glycosyltransferase involved in cell wall biosynthesis
VYAIEQFAAGLASAAEVHLIVIKGPPGALAGVAVAGAESLEPASLPNADVLIVPADARDWERLYALPPEKGRPVLLFQGYGAPGNPVVTASLQRADVVLSCSHWLVDEAARHGCQAFHVPYGIDRGLFRPGEPAEARPASVAMLVHRVSWKGTSEGLGALRILRAAVPEVRIGLFGERPPEGPPLPSSDHFLVTPDRRAVAGLLRQVAVYVCPSWEEGFGMPGLEALACGAALATTDTRGSRDYALPDRTALVSAPMDVEALAEDAITLLRDTELRGRLARAGQEYVGRHFGSWSEASERLAEVLHQVA